MRIFFFYVQFWSPKKLVESIWMFGKRLCSTGKLGMFSNMLGATGGHSPISGIFCREPIAIDHQLLAIHQLPHAHALAEFAQDILVPRS